MLFNSKDFLIFLPLVFFLYWCIPGKLLWLRCLLVLISSYIFYGWWEPIFLLLILVSTVTDYFTGLKIHAAQSNKLRKIYLLLSVLVNLGILFYFKYFNFFIESWVLAANSLGFTITNTKTLEIILPVGISFYTFQTMSYSIDIYYKKLEPTRDFIRFAAFVAFFPQLVAGPVERAASLLPQFSRIHRFNYDQGVRGLKLILWGLFKKMVIADSLAVYSDAIFSSHAELPASTLWLGAVYFSIRLYADFSGYSDVAIGTAKLLGFELMSNFRFPYFAENLQDFWNRWHISLSTWFRDYVYIPLGGSRGSDLKTYRNILVTFTVSGLWHGAGFTYVSWGLYHGILYLFPDLRRKWFPLLRTENVVARTVTRIASIIFTFILVTIGLVIFRSEDLESAGVYLKGMFTPAMCSPEHVRGLFYVAILLVADYFHRRDERNPLSFGIPWRAVRWLLYVALSFLVLSKLFGSDPATFIYFRF